MPVELNNESDSTVDEARLVAVAKFAMRAMRVDEDADLSIVIVDDDAMEQLHITWMDETGATDVLSFPMDELTPGAPDAPPVTGMLGDIVIAPTFSRAQAVAAGRDPEAELDLLMVHGVLHLLGYDHMEPDEASEMFVLQDRILAEHRAGGDAS